MILVTGCAGFIGYHVAKRCLELNMRVVGIDNLNDYYDVKLKEKRLKLLENKNFVFHKFDIENYDDMDFIFKTYKFCNIVHLAAQAGVRYSIENPFRYVNTNITGTLNILELMKKYKRNKLIIGSTSSLYSHQDSPFIENYIMKPVSPYAATKGAAELLSYTYNHLYGINVTVLRFFTVYGELGRPDMCCYKFIKAIKENKEITVYGDGKQKRDFTYVNDVVRAIIKAFIHEGYDLINIGTGKTITINELINKFEKLIGKKAKIKHEAFNDADMVITQADNTKALKELNWQPEYNIDNGLKKLLED